MAKLLRVELAETILMPRNLAEANLLKTVALLLILAIKIELFTLKIKNVKIKMENDNSKLKMKNTKILHFTL